MKKGKLIGVLLITTCMLTGCADNMPELTEEQSELIAEYAADLLLKYSPNYQYKIADEEELMEAETEETTQTETQEQPETEEVGTETQEQTGEEQSQEENDMEKASEFNLASIFDLENITIYYQSFEVADSYPSGGSESGFSVNAPQNQKLLILHFDVENTGTEPINCDLLEKVNKVRVNVNDMGYREALSTLLPNDFTTYMEEIPAGEKRDIVVAVSIGEDMAQEDITSLITRVVSGNQVVNIRME